MDMEQLQLQFANASDMKERSKLRTAIQNLRMKEEEGWNESPLSRRSFRRSRRLKSPSPEEQNLETISTNTDRTKTQLNSNEQESGVEVGKPQNFIRNSSIRRNRRSRSSRTSRSSDQDIDCSSPGYTNMDAVEKTHMGADKYSKPEETRTYLSPVCNTHSSQEDNFDNKNQVTCDVTTGKDSSRKGYIGNIHKENEAEYQLPKNTTVTQTRGATCQYNTIRTSFREPKWNPVSTPNKLPTHRQTQSANINNNNKQEWLHNRAGCSAYVPEVSSSGGDGESSWKLNSHQKHPARTVLKALSKKLFSAKPKSPSASGHQIPTTPTVKPTSEIAKFFPTAISTPKSQNTSYPVTSSITTTKSHKSYPVAPSISTPKFHITSYSATSSATTPKSHNTSYSVTSSTPKSHITSHPVTSSRRSPFQERKKVFEQKATVWKPTWGAVHNNQRRRTDKSSTMADVMSLSRPEEQRSTGSEEHEEPEVASDENEVGDSSLEELDSLLKQYKEDINKRVKIRETIRQLKESLREEDTSTSGSPTSADNSPAFGATPSTHKSVLTFSANSQQKEAQENTSFKVSIEKTPPSSRFVGRSTSLRAAKPSYTPPAEAINRASSFKLSRPKDFIVKKVDSTPQLAKVSEEFRDYADTLNNNVPNYEIPAKEDSSISNSTETSISRHNKTASPFSVSPKSSFRKTTWTPPILQKSSSNTSLVPARTVQVTSLRRSESTKENRSSDFTPIPIVRGNVRRSKSILGRILGQKIGLEKEPLTAAFAINPSLTAKDKFLDSTPKEPLNKSVSPIPESCLLETPNLQKSPEISRNLSENSDRSEQSSSTSSVSEEEHVYEVNSSKKSDSKTSTSSEDYEKLRDSVERDENAELESETVFEVDDKSLSTNETVELLKVEIVAPSGYNKETEYNDVTSENQENKETRLSSSNSSAELSDDEDSSPEDNMDRYSTRALQSRVSVKSQILATEGNKTNATSSRRLRERGNKPLNTGDDVKSRIQKYKVKLDDGDIEQIGEKTQRNGGVKVPGASGKKLDVSKFQTDRENVKIATPSSVKTSVTSTSTRSSNGSTSSSKESDRKTRNSSSSSATDDSTRQRRTRRAKAAETENGAEKLEKASAIVTSELKNSKVSSEITVSTKKSRERAVKEDVNNNNTKADKDIAPSNENVEVVIEDSLSNWSARRRKKREKRQDSSSNVTSGTDNDKSSEDTHRPKEPEPDLVDYPKAPETEVIPTIKHVPHSEPVLSNMDADLHGYSIKLKVNGSHKIESPKDETKEEIQNDVAKTTTSKSSRVRSRYSRSSETRSSTSSSNDVIENTQEDSNGKDGLFLAVDDGPAEIEMEAEPAKVEVSSNNDADISDKNIDDDVIEEKNVNERTDEKESEFDEEKKETEVQEVVEDNKETNEEVEKNESDVTSQADDKIMKTDEDKLSEEEIPDKITQNKEYSDEKVQPTQIEEIKTELTSDTVYKEDNITDEVKIDSEPEAAETQNENDTDEVGKELKPEPVIEPLPEQAVENTEKSIDSEKKHKKRHEKTKEASEEGEKSERRQHRHHRKKDKTSDDKTVEDEKPKKRRHRKKSAPDEDGKVVETDKVEEAKGTEKKSRKPKEEAKKESTPELPKEESKEKKSSREKNVEEKSKKPIEKEGETIGSKLEAKEEKSKKVTNKEEKSKTEKVEKTTKTEENKDKKEETTEMHFSYDNIEEISDINLLEKMLEASKEFDQRRQIRGVIRALKRGEKPSVTKHEWKPRNGSAVALKSKENQKDASPSPGDLALRSSKSRDGAKESRLTSTKLAFEKIESEFGSKYTSLKTERKTMTSGQKKIGSIFDRGDDEEDTRKSSRTSGTSRLADLERRQAERRRELQRNRSMPTSSSKDARKAFVAKLEASTPKTQAAKKVGRSPTFVVPNANNVKQLLLKWCQSKTRGYEHVDIMNFSSSWASGMAFCALVHKFFPEAFDYEKLDPKNRAENFDLAFKSADTHGEIPQLLDTEDMIRMAEPDWKCVYTYIGEFYKRIRDLGLN